MVALSARGVGGEPSQVPQHDVLEVERAVWVFRRIAVAERAAVNAEHPGDELRRAGAIPGD
jgi:hypothetical protein